MRTPATMRLTRDLKELRKDPPPGISAGPRENNMMIWDAIICGPADSNWRDGTFELSLEFSEHYPNLPPTARFISEMYHPNVFEDGTVCLDLLNDNWNAIYSVPFILVAIQSILCDPFVDSAANFSAARMFVTAKNEYDKRIREITEKSGNCTDIILEKKIKLCIDYYRKR